MKVLAKGFWLNVIFINMLYVDMYQDRTDATKTTVIVEKDGVVQTFTIDNKDLDKKEVLDKIEEMTHDKP